MIICFVATLHIEKWNKDDTDYLKAQAKQKIRISHLYYFAPFLFKPACMAEEQAQRNELFKQTIATWQDSSKADQHRLQAYLLCACASLNQHDPASLPEHDWLNSRHKFHQQRQGRLHHWTQTVADRLEFKWPELKNT